MRQGASITLMLLWSSLCMAGPFNIIPKPVELVGKSGSFTLTEDTRILCSTDCRTEALQLKHYLQPATGYALDLTNSSKAEANTILLRIDSGLSDLGQDGYR